MSWLLFLSLINQFAIVSKINLPALKVSVAFDTNMIIFTEYSNRADISIKLQKPLKNVLVLLNITYTTVPKKEH